MADETTHADAARAISGFLREQAGRLPLNSPLRAAALGSALRWGQVS